MDLRRPNKWLQRPRNTFLKEMCVIWVWDICHRLGAPRLWKEGPSESTVRNQPRARGGRARGGRTWGLRSPWPAFSCGNWHILPSKEILCCEARIILQAFPCLEMKCPFTLLMSFALIPCSPSSILGWFNFPERRIWITDVYFYPCPQL